ncbi:SDR family oxidoreductase [Streptomyces sp. NPDC054775]
MSGNACGVWDCLRARIPAMLGAGAGVNTSSLVRLRAAPVAAPYGAAGQAAWLTGTSAAEDAAQGICVNAIAPGTARTESIEDWFAQVPGTEDALHSMTPRRGPPTQSRRPARSPAVR